MTLYLMKHSYWNQSSLNCAYFGIPCVGNNRADTQNILFPKLSFDVYNIEGALNATKRLKEDKEFYNECSLYAKEIYKKEFTKEKFIEIFNKNY